MEKLQIVIICAAENEQEALTKESEIRTKLQELADFSAMTIASTYTKRIESGG